MGNSKSSCVETNLDGKKPNYLGKGTIPPPLPTNEAGSKRRLDSMIRKLEQTGQYESYDKIIQEQRQLGIIEKALRKATGKEFYIPHKGMTRENVQKKYKTKYSV